MDDHKHRDINSKINIARELSEFQKKLSDDQLKHLHLEDLISTSRQEVTGEELKARISSTISVCVSLSHSLYNKRLFLSRILSN